MSGKAFENEYISRREAIKARKRSCNRNCLECDFAIEGDSWCNGEVFVVDLLRIPPADVRPVVHGKWIFDVEPESVIRVIKQIHATDVVPASDFRDCRNELCLKCGAYTQKHNGACDECRWRQT